MRSIKNALKVYSQRKALSIAKAKAKELVKEYGFYKNEVETGLRYVESIICSDGNTGLLFSPMQSGKTNIIACVFYLMKELIPEIRGVFICANDQIDLRRQNRERLAHLPDFEVLNRVERRDWDRIKNSLLLAFYDENHFGDGVTMTINEFLELHDIKQSPSVLFSGVSATPFSSLGILDFEVWPKMSMLERAGYNSIDFMLRNRRIVNADPLFTKSVTGRITVNESANVYKHIEKIMSQRVPKGFGMIRASTQEAEELTEYLTSKFGWRIFITDWNQNARDFSPESFFKNPKPGVFTLVIVQHKARMGNTINTEHFEFMYEHSPSAALDTTLQSFLGRACGFTKQKHKCVVYSDPRKAQAYNILIQGDGSKISRQKFIEYCRDHGIKPSIRATLNTRVAQFEVEQVETKQFHGHADFEKSIRPWIERVVNERGFGKGTIRKLSKTEIKQRKAGRASLHPSTSNSDGSLYCAKSPGSWSAFVYDDYNKKNAVKRKKDWKGIIVKVAVRTGRATNRDSLSPTPASLYDGMRA